MATLDLSTLVEWARRSGGDALALGSDSFTGDGTTNSFTLSVITNVTVTSVTVDGVPASPTVANGTVTFASAPVDGAEIVVAYTHSAHTDAEMLDWLDDAARSVAGDLNADWTLAAHVLSSAADTFTFELQSLIVLRSSVTMAQHRAAATAGAGVMIQDGDTKLDLSRTADQLSKRIAALYAQYKDALDRALGRRMAGQHIQGCGATTTCEC